MSPLTAVALAALSNTAEITSTNIRSGAAFDNIKATWNQALKLGDFATNLKCNYDYKDNKDFLKDCSLSGDLLEGASDDDVRVSYEVSHNFGDRKTNLKLSANTHGTTFGATVDDRQLTEVSATRDIDVADRSVNTDASWLVKAQTARVKLMSKLGSDRVKATVDFNPDDKSTSYELGYERQLEEGRDVSATFNPGNHNLDVELVDNKFESGATWTAKASVPTDASNNILDAAKLTLKRSWNW
jgi:hypothetical protein